MPRRTRPRRAAVVAPSRHARRAGPGPRGSPARRTRRQALRDALDDRIIVAPEDRLRLRGAERHHVIARFRVEGRAVAQRLGRTSHLRRTTTCRLGRRAARRLGGQRKPELVARRRAAIGGERLGAAAAVAQRADELEPERLAQRVLHDERGELVQDRSDRPRESCASRRPPRQAKPPLVEPRDLRRGVGLVAHAVERRSAPESERRLQHCAAAAAGSPRVERGLALGGEAVEAICVDRLGAAGARARSPPRRDHRIRAHGPPQARDDQLERVGRIGGELLCPQRIDGAVGGARARRAAPAAARAGEAAGRASATPRPSGRPPRPARGCGTASVRPGTTRTAIVASRSAAEGPTPCKRSMRRRPAAARALAREREPADALELRRWPRGRAAAHPAARPAPRDDPRARSRAGRPSTLSGAVAQPRRRRSSASREARRRSRPGAPRCCQSPESGSKRYSGSSFQPSSAIRWTASTM